MTDTCDFQLVTRATGDGDIEVKYYKSSTTGMTVAIVGVEGPIVNGYFCVDTEAHDDGFPNALKRLIFCGSEDYPYKGVLDKMANRCFANGTNAFTHTDNTFYTLSTAGSDGFLNLLPVYLDHILFPTLTDAAFTTEVHHINAKGEDAGLVYKSHKFLKENNSDRLIKLKMLQMMYPRQFKSNTAGIMKNLRESTTNEKVRAFHKAYYRSENLCVIICGQVEPVAVFKSLESLESKIISRRNPEPFERPWQTPVEPLKESVETTIQCPSKYFIFYDNFSIAWRGPLMGKEYDMFIALDVLLDYLTNSGISPLQQEFVKCDDSYCSRISIYYYKFYEFCIEIRFGSVEKEKRHAIKDKLFEVLRKIGNKQTPIDMNRMVDVIHRKKMQHLSSLETAPHKPLAMEVIGYFLYGKEKEDLSMRIRQIPVLDQLMKKDEQFWIDLLNRYFLGDAKHIVLVVEPSPKKLAETTKEEKQHLENQHIDIEELKLLGIEAAIETHEIEPPISMIQSVPVPGVDSIHFHSIKRFNNYSNKKCNVPGFSCLSKMPFRFLLDDVKTNFVTMRVLIDTSKCLSSYQRLFLPLFISVVNDFVLFCDEFANSYEDVLNEFKIDKYFRIGVDESYTFSQVLMLMVKVEPDKYEKGLRMLNELIDSTFTIGRVKRVAHSNLLFDSIRDEEEVSRIMIKSMCFQPESNHWAVGFYRQKKFLNDLVKKMESSPEEVVDELDKIQLLITDPDNLTVHVSANFSLLNEKCPNAGQLWIEHFLPEEIYEEPVSGPMKVVPCSGYLVKENSGSGSMVPRGSIAGVGSFKSSYMLLCVESISSWTDPQLAPLLVLLEYFNHSKDLVRKNRYMNNFDIFLCISQGLLFLKISDVTKLVKAYIEAKNFFNCHLKYDIYKQSLLEESRSKFIYNFIQKCGKSVDDLSFESMFCYLRGVDINYNKELINSVSRVTISDLKRVAAVYLQPLLDPTKARISVCCHPLKVDVTIRGFKELGIELCPINIEEENFMSNIETQ